MIVSGAAGVARDDRALVAEALRRVQAGRDRPADNPEAVLQAITTALLQGRRDLFSLVKAGRAAV